MDANYFIKKFSAIPDNKWRSDGYYGNPGEPRCVLGHLGMTATTVGQLPEVDALYIVLGPVNLVGGVTNLNDVDTVRFSQTTPKARILAALEFSKTL